MDTHAFSLRLGFGHTLTATWLMSLGLEPAVTTETEYLWHEGQLDAARRAIHRLICEEGGQKNG